ncbi:glycoside hydrolase family 47 protein [Aestuariivivens insulae]|uniref:glycoside hydrolase family 47 protein n=1 Tax=Aestuariivivens insulae TaxID=1621988 RepID=UPI001F57E341|nr:glycoside hydrolase family 47 protein [Aestuariivivens insulae]
MKRRDFIQLSTITGVGLSLSVTNFLSACDSGSKQFHSSEYRTLVFNLLKDWCDGMIKTQIIKPLDPKVHGLLDCPACETVHARIMDAVYPFFYMAKATGDKKYLDAGIAAFEWGKNVTRDDGAWTNDLDPKSWDGTTVFGAIALAETLKYHGNLLDESTRERWYKRLKSATEFVFNRFYKVDAANINYGATTIYALNLIGKLLNSPKYISRNEELVLQVKSHFTEPNTLLFGEIQGKNKKALSPKGLPGIDLGYNIEESLNNLVLYALEEKDEELLQLLKKSLDTHLEFILPDGGVDNSFGNRMFKWTYWGSRTSDGMQPAFGFMAGHNPALGTATFKNTELLKQCTHNGLLHGGPHYMSYGIKPCVHHTFAHAKPLATLLDHWDILPKIDKSRPLPRTIADGERYFEELDVSLFARGDWRGTVSAYDSVYSPRNDVRQATGASIGLLYHNKVGLLCVASTAIYKMLEAYNQQPQPEEDFALTPRIETYKDEVWYSNLFDLETTFTSKVDAKTIEYKANVRLKNEAKEIASETASNFELNYTCSEDKLEITVTTNQDIKTPTAFVLPIVSPTGEKVQQISENEITIEKPNGTVKVTSSGIVKIKEMPKSRVFNMVPGVEAVPLIMPFEDKNQVKITITII